MQVAVLGAGVVGVTTAWYLAQAGHQVTVIERQAEAGLETSFANGGQISVCHAEPWANPKAVWKILQWLGEEDAPLLFRLKFDWAQWRWGMRFMLECFPERARSNLKNLVKLGLYSRQSLQELRAQTGIEYDALTRGILHYYTDEPEFAAAVKAAALMRDSGLDRQVKSQAECVGIEPALRQTRRPIVGGTYTATDESGDAMKFTQALAALCLSAGVKFRYETEVMQIHTTGDAIEGVKLRAVGEGAQNTELLKADAYVVCMGSYSSLLLRSIGMALDVYPAKGYSATIPVRPGDEAPMVALTDDGCKIVYSRLGDRLRVAGTAEINGYNLDLTPVRCQALIKRTQEIFPHAGDFAAAEFWTGLRPSTPSNLPFIGRVGAWKNLWLNTGHGTLGWTESCGSGRALACLLDGKTPEVEFPFLGAS